MPLADLEARRAYKRDWYAKNKDKIRAYFREWDRQNPEKRKRYQRAKLLSRYGITIDDYDLMMERQDGACAICGATEAAASRFHSFAVDHDHETGIVRGLLCIACNRAIGLLGDDPDLLRKAALYVEVHPAPLS